MENVRVYRGNIVYSKSSKELVELIDGAVVVKDGIVIGAFEKVPKEYREAETVNLGDGVLIPAFSDLHVHAPQYPNRGIAMDALLYDWLHRYTFPLEANYADLDFAKAVYTAFVNDMVRYGTMHAFVYGTVHVEATSLLVDLFEKKGLPSFIGKINMDKDSPESLLEETHQSVVDTEAFLLRHRENKYAKPILTPRFAPTCSFDLLKELSELAKRYDMGTQTHIVESLWETEECKKCFEGCRCDMQIYEEAGLLKNPPFVAAHFIFPCEEDLVLLKGCGGYAVHCPESTTNVIAGIMPLGKFLDQGLNLGLGSDIAAGAYLGVYRQVASAIGLSKIKAFYEPDNRSVTFPEAFYLATKGGGSAFGKVGSFEQGYAFDALVIDGLNDDFRPLRPSQIIERFCYGGDPSHIKHRYLRGKEI